MWPHRGSRRARGARSAPALSETSAPRAFVSFSKCQGGRPDWSVLEGLKAHIARAGLPATLSPHAAALAFATPARTGRGPASDSADRRTDPLTTQIYNMCFRRRLRAYEQLPSSRVVHLALPVTGSRLRSPASTRASSRPFELFHATPRVHHRVAGLTVPRQKARLTRKGRHSCFQSLPEGIDHRRSI